MEYTKGEWTFHKDSDVGDWIVCAPNITVAQSNSYQMQQAEEDGISFTAEESYTNGRLIASAPDLYEALKMAIRALENNDIDEMMAGEFEILTDAIDKAEGNI